MSSLLSTLDRTHPLATALGLVGAGVVSFCDQVTPVLRAILLVVSIIWTVIEIATRIRAWLRGRRAARAHAAFLRARETALQEIDELP